MRGRRKIICERVRKKLRKNEEWVNKRPRLKGRVGRGETSDAPECPGTGIRIKSKGRAGKV